MKNFAYSPPPTGYKFMTSATFGRFMLGPVGSGKTMLMIMEMLRRAAQQKPASDGIRYTRFAIVRNTLQQLKTTILKDIELVLGPIIDYRVSESTIYIRKGDIHSEWLMIPLETEVDQKRLLSTQLTGAWINEFIEIPVSLVDAVSGRLGRYPNPLQGGATWHGLIGDSNFPSEDSEWYEAFETKPHENWEVFKQPGGLDPDAENLENLLQTDESIKWPIAARRVLGRRYYENLVHGHNEDWVNRYVHAKYGRSLSGQAVFRASFDPDYHVAKTELLPTPNYPIIVAVDFGRTPAALITQTNHRGSLLVLAEATSEDMGLRQFLREKLRPILSGPRFVTMPSVIVGDPAGKQKSQLSEETAFDVLRAEGFMAYPAATNDIAPRLRAVEKRFLERIGEIAGILIDGPNCPDLVRALKHEYRYRKKKTGELEDVPEKKHPWSDIADCLQYACLGANGGLTAKLMRPARPVQQRIPARAWT